MLPSHARLQTTADSLPYLNLMFKTLILISALLLSCSCSFFESFSKGDKVAQIGNAVLYKSDIDKVLPKGASAQDSTLFADQYVNSWALKQLLLNKAQEQLPKADKDVSALLEDYRTQLLVFRYETRYVEERLDTLVTEEERKEYYAAHQESFVTLNGVFRGRFVKMHNSSPNLQMVRKLSGKNDVESVEKLEEIAYNAAHKFDNYGDNWVDMPIVARDMDVDLQWFVESLGKKGVIEHRDSSYSNFVQIVEFVLPGEISPYEYNREKIGNIILSRRKQELVTVLHKEILNDALAGNKIKYTGDEDN